MRKKIVAGNWKMNKSLQEGLTLIDEINVALDSNPITSSVDEIGVVMCTPFIHLAQAVKKVNHPHMAIGAQNLYNAEKGAYTGETSADMIKSTAAEYVIIGHSERRAYFAESHQVLAEKVELALAAGLKPIFCCGEVLDEREAGIQETVVEKQLKESVFHLSPEAFEQVVVAYEPVWAIGTGKTASSDQAQEMHAFIRALIRENYNEKIADDTTIIYGGSCNPKNAQELFANPDVDGGLIGGASLKSEDFVHIIHSY